MWCRVRSLRRDATEGWAAAELEGQRRRCAGGAVAGWPQVPAVQVTHGLFPALGGSPSSAGASPSRIRRREVRGRGRAPTRPSRRSAAFTGPGTAVVAGGGPDRTELHNRDASGRPLGSSGRLATLSPPARTRSTSMWGVGVARRPQPRFRRADTHRLGSSVLRPRRPTHPACGFVEPGRALASSLLSRPAAALHLIPGPGPPSDGVCWPRVPRRGWPEAP